MAERALRVGARPARAGRPREFRYWPVSSLASRSSVWCGGATDNRAERTCATWLERLRSHRDDAVRVAGPELVDRYERYLDLCVRGWQLGATQLLRISMRRMNHPRL